MPGDALDPTLAAQLAAALLQPADPPAPPPAAEAPKAEAPKAEAPKAEAPKAEAPTDIDALRAELAELKAWRERTVVEQQLARAKLDPGLLPVILAAPAADRERAITLLSDKVASLRAAPPPGGTATELPADPTQRLLSAARAVLNR